MAYSAKDRAIIEQFKDTAARITANAALSASLDIIEQKIFNICSRIGRLSENGQRYEDGRFWFEFETEGRKIIYIVRDVNRNVPLYIAEVEKKKRKLLFIDNRDWLGILDFYEANAIMNPTNPLYI